MIQNSGTTYTSPEKHRGLFLNTEPGVVPEHNQAWPPKPQNKNKKVLDPDTHTSDFPVLTFHFLFCHNMPQN